MAEKSPHVFCRLCQTNHPLGGPHAWDKPTGTKEQRMQIADAVLSANTKAQPKARKKSTAARKDVQRPARSGNKTSEVDLANGANGSPKPRAGSIPDQSSAGTQAPPVDTTTRGMPRKRAPKGTFDRKAYQREAARKRRAARKASKDGA